MNFISFKEISEVAIKRFADSPLGKMSEGKVFDKPMSEYDKPLSLDSEQMGLIIQNKQDGTRREDEVENDLKNKYPESEGYTILREVYLRDESGNIVKDPVTGEARRIDFVVVDKNGNPIDCIEVTSKTADKTVQSEKEQRIRDNGGNYVKLPDGSLTKIPDNIQTRIERRE